MARGCSATDEDPLAATNPWFRETDVVDLHRYNLSRNFSIEKKMKLPLRLLPRFEVELDNAFPDLRTKKAVLKISSSVVSLLSYTGEQVLTQCSGVIIENDGNNGYIVLTSANIIRRPTEDQTRMMEDVLADSLKVTIGMCDGGLHEGKLCSYDFHYNLAWIMFHSDSSYATAKLRDLNDFINVNPSENDKSSFHPSPHSNNIVPGNSIIAVGRYFIPPYDLMAAPGEFSLALSELDCKELFMGTCKITKCGEGGVILNISGKVIGITIYFENGFPTPFLPINIALRCWENYKTYGKFRRPSLGFEATNLYAASMYIIEKTIQKIPSVCNGVVVEKVIQDSSADFAGLQSDDVIVRCDGKMVHSFLEFLNLVWNTKAGDELLLSVARVDQNDLIHLRTVVNEVAVENFNSWPWNYY